MLFAGYNFISVSYIEKLYSKNRSQEDSIKNLRVLIESDSVRKITEETKPKIMYDTIKSKATVYDTIKVRKIVYDTIKVSTNGNELKDCLTKQTQLATELNDYKKRLKECQSKLNSNKDSKKIE